MFSFILLSLSRRRHFFPVIAILLGFGGSLRAAAAEPGGALVTGELRAAAVAGSVVWTGPGKDGTVTTVTEGMALPVGARLVTGPESSVVVVLASGSSFRLGENTEVQLAKFVQTPFPGVLRKGEEEPSESQTAIRLRRGELTSRVRKLQTGSTWEVQTPLGVAGVRGTVFRITIDPATGTFGLVVTEGEVGFVSVWSEEWDVVEARSLQIARAVSAGAPGRADFQGSTQDASPAAIARINAAAREMAAASDAYSAPAASGSEARKRAEQGAERFPSMIVPPDPGLQLISPSS
ncbi:hypothetical protein OpiT1DRAFT_04733 [Opitutaceae bacterium TAV1]|nr:hypothetical protein OpiT1DRAFT_04733 [Opitutaceae bacterium TAV1]